MINFQDLNNLAEINFKSKDRPELKELADYIDTINQYLTDILTVDETVISIDARFFDTGDID